MPARFYFSTFNFTFDQQYSSPILTINSISGFTSTPAFTPTTDVFTFNSKGSPIGSTTFGFNASNNNLSIYLISELYKNGILQASETFLIASPTQCTFVSPINVSGNDTILINLFYAG